MFKRVTIKSIADDLGISHMTVSRALSGNPNVQKETRDRVVQRAQELGYVRSAAANAMRGDLSPIVGLLIPNIINDFYARYANRLAETCEAHGLQLIIHLTKDDYQAEQLAITRLREVQARAVVTVPTPLPAAGAEGSMPDIQMEMVQLIRKRAATDPVGSVLVDDAQALLDGVQYLYDRGHRRIAYLGASETLSSGRGRLEAYQRGIIDAGLAIDPSLILVDSPSLEMGERLTHRILDLTDATAVLCGGFEISNGALKALMQRDVLGTGLDFVGYGDPAFYSWIKGGLATIQVPVDELALCTVDLITQEKTAERGKDHGFTATFLGQS